jgi:hypothetical protein
VGHELGGWWQFLVENSCLRARSFLSGHILYACIADGVKYKI